EAADDGHHRLHVGRRFLGADRPAAAGRRSGAAGTSAAICAAGRGGHSMSASLAAKRGPALDPRVIGVIWRREMLRYFRERSQPLGGLSRTILWLIILGFGLGASL